jgi:hypothetical protein
MEEVLGSQLASYVTIGSLLATLLTVIIAAVALKYQKNDAGNDNDKYVDSISSLVKQQSNDFNRATQSYQSLSLEQRGILQSLALNIQKLNNDLEQHARYSSSEYNAIREEIFEIRKEISRIQNS